MSQPENPSLSPVQEEAAIHQRIANLLSEQANYIEMKLGPDANADEIRALCAALPALLEASRDRDTAQLQRNVLQLEAVDHTLKMIELKDELAGSISERETLTARLLDFENREGACCPEDVGFEEYIKTLQAAVARLTTERTHDAEVLDRTRERWADAREAVASLTTRTAQLETQLEASQRVREQAIQDIEALPRYEPVESSGSTEIREGVWAADVAEVDDGEYLEREAVLDIMRRVNNA